MTEKIYAYGTSFIGGFFIAHGIGEFDDDFPNVLLDSGRNNND